MVKYLMIIGLLMISRLSMACDVCQKQQPKMLRGITHGAGPEGNWDYFIVGVTAVIVLITLVYSIKSLVKPGEKSETHIKRLFIE